MPSPLRGLKFAHGAVQWLAADAATTQYAVTGLGFTPKAIRFYAMGLGSASDTASEATHSRRCIGFATSTSLRRCVGSQDQDTAATSVCTAGLRDDCVAMTITSTPAFDGMLDLHSLDVNGFTLIVDDQAPVNLTVFWEAWGGPNILGAEVVDIAEPAATGAQSYGTMQPSVLMFAGCQSVQAANTSERKDSGLCVGFASSPAAADQVVVTGNSDDASAAMDTDGYCQDGECLAMIVLAGGTSVDARASLTSVSPTGFTLNWAARAVTSRRYIALAIRGGEWKAGALSIAGNSLGATATVSGLRFEPCGLSLFGRMVAESTAATAAANDRIALGTGSSPSSRRSMGHLSEDATASSVCEIDLCIEYDQVLAYPSTAGALLTAFDIDSMNGASFRLITDVAGGAASEFIGYLAFGNPLNAIQNYMSVSAPGMSVHMGRVR